jgi:multidrug resistance efflux pump
LHDSLPHLRSDDSDENPFSPATAGLVCRLRHGVVACLGLGDHHERVTSAVASTASAGSALTTAQAQMDGAKSRQALAASEARRFADLGRKGFVSQSVVDGKLQQQQSADAQGAAAESTLTSARQDLVRIKVLASSGGKAK